MSLIPTSLASAASVFATAQPAVATSAAKTTSAYDTTSTSTSSTDSSTISSTDFLTLLVTEMKNQDPTQPTDPTQYVQQLVGVNSLEQLIDINKAVSSTGTSTSATTAV